MTADTKQQTQNSRQRQHRKQSRHTAAGRQHQQRQHRPRGFSAQSRRPGGDRFFRSCFYVLRVRKRNIFLGMSEFLALPEARNPYNEGDFQTIRTELLFDYKTISIFSLILKGEKNCKPQKIISNCCGFFVLWYGQAEGVRGCRSGATTSAVPPRLNTLPAAARAKR